MLLSHISKIRSHLSLHLRILLHILLRYVIRLASRSNQRNNYFIGHILVEAVTENISYVLRDKAGYIVVGVFEFAVGQIVTRLNTEDDTGSSCNTRIEYICICCHFDCFEHSVRRAVSFALAYTHMGVSFSLHYRLDICKVEIDKAGIIDKVAYALDGVFKNFVGFGVSLGHKNILVVFEKFLIRNYDKRIDILLEFFDTRFGNCHLACFESERLGNDSNDEHIGIEFSCEFCNYGRSTRSGTAAHTCRYKEKVGILEHIHKSFSGLLCCFFTDFGFCARALSPSELDAYLYSLVFVDL